jgi:dimethylaniline monooxygenase (N-oxide forming)
MYDGFWTQWTHGLSEFSDLPMTRSHETDCYHGFYRAKYTTGYLEEYCNRQDESGRYLCDRMVFHANVDSVRKVNNAWNVRVEAAVFATKRLMVASGLLQGKEIFCGAIVHTEGFGDSKMMENSEIKRLVVIVAGKSAADAVFMGVKSGKVVHWVIRANGREHAFFASVL